MDVKLKDFLTSLNIKEQEIELFDDAKLTNATYITSLKKFVIDISCHNLCNPLVYFVIDKIRNNKQYNFCINIIQHETLVNSTYLKDIFEKVHIHHIKYNNEEYLVLKNFGKNFHDYKYGFANFPQGNWNEIFNSDASQFGGFNFINSDRPNGSINSGNQGLNLAPNSVIILKKV